MIRKKPWNRVSLPVFSVCSRSNGDMNMNICTYVTGVSMKPKRFAVALFHGSLTLKNVEKEHEFVLQLLKCDQYNLIRLLGQQTGRKVNKIKKLEKRKELIDWEGYKVLKGCLAVMKLRVESQQEGGDHDFFICDLVVYKNLQEGKELTTAILSEKKIIRI